MGGRTLLSESEAAGVLQSVARRLQRRYAKKAPPRKKVEHGKVATLIHRLQANAVPLQLGIVLALVWANVHQDSYERVVGTGPTRFASGRAPPSSATLSRSTI
jgi:hypothetical protein